MKSSRWLGGWLALAWIPLVVGVDAGEPAKTQPNVVIILIDTLRKDHVGSLGYPLDTTPYIDSLASTGLLFANAVSQAPWTAPSMASIWTSRYPHEIGVQAISDEEGLKNIDKLRVTPLSDEFQTLAELLSAAGYRTIAVTENPYCSNKFGILRGFQDVVAHTKRDGAAKIVDDALAILQKPRKNRASSQPFLIYLHFADVHQPTHPPEPYDTMFATLDGASHGNQHYNWDYQRHGADLEGDGYKVYRSHKIALYDGSLRFIDEQVKRFAGALEGLGYLDDTIFVIASDHGEEFWEHRDFEELHHLDPRDVVGVSHGHSLFAELLDVPLIISGQGVPTEVVSSQVRNLDIAPTILGLTGTDAVGDGMHGVDLVKWLAAGSADRLPAYSEDLAYGFEAKAIQDGAFKYIEYSNTKNGPGEFMYRHGDEQHDVLQDYPERANALRARLREIYSSNQRGNETMQQAAPLDEATMRQLKELGYGN